MLVRLPSCRTLSPAEANCDEMVKLGKICQHWIIDRLFWAERAVTLREVGETKVGEAGEYEDMWARLCWAGANDRGLKVVSTSWKPWMKREACEQWKLPHARSMGSTLRLVIASSVPSRMTDGSTFNAVFVQLPYGSNSSSNSPSSADPYLNLPFPTLIGLITSTTAAPIPPSSVLSSGKQTHSALSLSPRTRLYLSPVILLLKSNGYEQS